MNLKPDGFTCKCGREEKYPAYVAAHWREALTYTCPDCQRRYLVQRGIATLEQGKPRKKRVAK